MLKQKPPITPVEDKNIVTSPEPEYINPFTGMYEAVKKAILTIKENPLDDFSPPYFKTIAIDTGQFERLIRSNNMEFETEFPAVFIHFTNVRYLVQQQRIGEGRAIMRIRFILNNLNNQSPANECLPFDVFQKINVVIQDAKSKEPLLNERCNLLFFDMPTTTNMLQAYWVDYEVWFREYSTWVYKDWVERYLVMPPFTDHEDAPEHDKDGHGKHEAPTYEDSSGITHLIGDSTDEEDKEEEDTP